jgi:hypothetical protein
MSSVALTHGNELFKLPENKFLPFLFLSSFFNGLFMKSFLSGAS